ncbi:unnamed protein product [Clonostachys chloroleuca]|uniref:Uncharacterized protein n=1 Tax=Clonostachys chloroleuca TaxID=1926264 RepID=A0AA35LXB9_9HYPO|nr:unnamed protein product [Clonostachys chloroleuca]
MEHLTPASSKQLLTQALDTIHEAEEEVKNITSKGSQASYSGGFASMDPDKQRDIASKGGQASSRSFEPGSEKAKEAGYKGELK